MLNVVNGDKEAVDAILEDPDIQAVSFVGSSAIAEYVYSRGTAHGKRVQAMGGAKNHAIIMPDADLDQVTNELIGAGYGSAGERCMAISVAVPVDREDRRRAGRATEAARGIVAGRHRRPIPMRTMARSSPPPIAEKVMDYIDLGVKEGAELVVDGRGFKMQGYEKGFYLGGSLFDRVTPDMKTYQEEIFGPVLQIARATGFRRSDRAALEPSIWQRRRDLHPRRRCGARIRRARQSRHGRHQHSDPRAARLSHLRRLEALGLRRY